MHRRDFLTRTMAFPALAALGHDARQRRGRVVILGAGLAGLAAGHDLEAAGYDVTILEARPRPGGRVYTLREPFGDGLYAEAGAARIQDTHSLTLRYAKQFGLALDPFFPSSGQRVTLVGGKRIVGAFDLDALPLEFSAEDRKRGFGGNLNHYLFRHLAELGDVSQPTWPSADVSRFEVAIDEFCRRQGASPGVIAMIALGHDLIGMSTLQFLRDAALGIRTKMWFKIRGGNDLLPKAFATALASRIRYGAPVVRIEQSDTSVRAVCLRGGESVRVEGDYMISTIPTPVMQRVDIAPGFSSARRAAIAQVGSLAMARVHLQARERFWLARGESGWGATDDPMDVWDYTRDQPGTRGILGAYLSGRMATRVTALDERERASFVLDCMERLHPGMREHFEVSASHSWIGDPWALGAGVAFDAGQLTRHYHDLRRPEGRIHFAGEHTSPWAGWMNGAIESGLRAAHEIRDRSK
jgi:monoamine oxidase